MGGGGNSLCGYIDNIRRLIFMNKKIVVALLTAIVLVVTVVALVGCNTPATISLNGDGTVSVEVGNKVAVPVTVTGELQDSQVINFTLVQGSEVVSLNRETMEITGLKEGYAIILVELDGNELLTQVMVKDTAGAEAYTEALEAAVKQIEEYPVPEVVAEYGDSEYVTALKAEYESYKSNWVALINKADTASEIDNIRALAVEGLNTYASTMSSKVEGLITVAGLDFSADIPEYAGLDPELLNKAITSENYQLITNKTDGTFYTEAEELIKSAESPSDVLNAMSIIMSKYNETVRLVVVDVMFEQIGLDYEAGDSDLLDKLEDLEDKLTDADKELYKQISEAIETIKLMQQVELLNIAGGTYVYDGTYHTFSNLSDCTITYSVDGIDYVDIGEGIKNAGNYSIKATKNISIVYGEETLEIECVAYGNLTIMKATLPTPIWPTVSAEGVVIYTKLKDIPLIGGVPGEGSPYDDPHLFGGRVNGIFRWYEEEREVDPVNFGYAMEFVPVVCDADGQPIIGEDGNYIFDNNYHILRQIIEVPVKDAYVVVTPVEGQWKNYDGTTATDIKYEFVVYTDSTKTEQVTLTDKLRDYITKNLTGALVLEDDPATPEVEPAKDSGHWYIEQGTLDVVPGAKLVLEYSNPGITYEIRPLVIAGVDSLVVEKVYDATVNVPDKDYEFVDYYLTDSEGNPVEKVEGVELRAYITGAEFEDKNVGENKIVNIASADVTITENGGALRNYVVTPETYENIKITGTITVRPITLLTGRIEARAYDGTDIAYYETEDKTQRLMMVQGVDLATGELIDAEFDITTLANLMDDDVSINLLGNGRYVGDDNVGTRGKDVGINKSILFNNSSDVTTWELIGEDAHNYEYVGALADVDPNKAEKVTYYGDIYKLIAEGNVELAGLEAIKQYDGNDICYINNLITNEDGTIKCTLTFTESSVTTIRNDVITIDQVIANGKYTLDDYVTGVSDVGDHKVAFDISAFNLGGDWLNYDWTGYIVKGIGTITPIVVEFDTTALAELNERTYDATSNAYALPIGGEGGLRNFNIVGEGILTGVKFTNLLPGDEFYIRILKDEDGDFYNGQFEDKNVGTGKIALWAAGTWELVEIPGNSGKASNYIFNTVDLPAVGDIIQKRITTVKFSLESRIYDATDVTYIENVYGQRTMNEDGTAILEVLIDFTNENANLIIEEMCAGDDLKVIIKGDGVYTAGKNVSNEKEAKFELWDIIGEDAHNYRFSAAIEPYETTPTTTVIGIGAVTQKQITAINIKNYTVTKAYDGTARANFAQLNEAIASGIATVEFEGMFAGDNLSIEITAYGEFGSFVENVWTASAEVGDHMVRYTRKNSTGDDRNNYYIDSTDVYVENGSIT